MLKGAPPDPCEKLFTLAFLLTTPIASATVARREKASCGNEPCLDLASNKSTLTAVAFHHYAKAIGGVEGEEYEKRADGV